MTTIVESLRIEANATEELDATNSSVPVMRNAADLIEALLNRDHRMLVLNMELLASLGGILFHFGNPKRDEWLNDAAFEEAKAVDARARALVAKAKDHGP